MLQESVASVLAQDYDALEIILVDDGSDDETPKVISNLKREDPRIRSLKTHRSGPGLAREAGRLKARGEYIQYLDSDDLLYPHKFARQVDMLERHPGADVAYCRTVYRGADGKPQVNYPGKRTHERIERMWPSFLVSRWWSTLTPLYRKSVCDRVGPWSDLRQDEDWEYESRVATAGGWLCYVDNALCEVRHHTGHRASGGAISRQMSLQHRARARELIYAHARAAGIKHCHCEMQHFARSTFFLSRQCGAGGITAESRMLYRLSRDAAGPKAKLDHRFYGFAAGVFGWSGMGTLSEWGDRWRK